MKSFSERLYSDRYCADGVIAHGWRRVKKNGIKFGGAWYWSDRLSTIIGELVHVQMNGD